MTRPETPPARVNPDFAKALRDRGVDLDQLTEDGFRGSRRGVNLEKRMRDNCPDEQKKVETAPGPSLTDLPGVYQRLGKELGYFDASGKLLKPLPDLTTNSTQNLSKKQRVERLNQMVSNLPLGASTQSRIDAAKQSLKNLQNQLSQLNQQLPNLTGTTQDINQLINGPLANLSQALQPPGLKFPNPALSGKLSNLLGQSQGLLSSAQSLLGRANQTGGLLEKLTQGLGSLGALLGNGQKNLGNLLNQFQQLQKQRDAIVAQLGDKPKKIIDQLEAEVEKLDRDAKKLMDQIGQSVANQQQLQRQLADLQKQRQRITGQHQQLEQDINDLTQQLTPLQETQQRLQQLQDQAKRTEKKFEEKLAKVKELPSPDQLRALFNFCDEDLNSWLNNFLPLHQARQDLNQRLSGMLSRTKGLKFDDFRLDSLKLFAGQRTRALDQITGLEAMVKATETKIQNTWQQATGQQTQLTTLSERTAELRRQFDQNLAKVDSLKRQIPVLDAQRNQFLQLVDRASQPVDALNAQADTLLARFDRFAKSVICPEKPGDLNELLRENETAERMLRVLEDNLHPLEREGSDLSKRIRTTGAKLREEQRLQRDFGREMDLQPVEIEEWSESFSVERDFWRADFHPDDEVVEGYRGRYFAIQLRDADKNVKLLFGPGEYYMDRTDFRERYGAVIGAFVTETLQALKETDRDRVRLFVQGSADITGQNTFRGDLDERFLYESVDVLPREGNSDGFGGSPRNKSIPNENFTNEHLPDLRGQFLREMIGVYSKKLQPVLLEGTVKDIADKEKRNAIIYLFLPEEILIP